MHVTALAAAFLMMASGNPGEVKQLEAESAAHPDDLGLREQILKHYFLERSPESRAARERHVLWVIEHHPEADVAGTPFAGFVRVLEPGSYEKARTRWMANVGSNAVTAAVVGNAARFFTNEDRPLAIRLYRKAAALEARNATWPLALAGAHELDDAHAEALAEYEKGLAIADGPTRFYALGDAAAAALAAGAGAKARAWATELLRLAETYGEQEWNYGNAIHDGHRILGHLSLRAGDVAGAKAHLLKAGATPGSPQLNSFGPELTLAADLLARGERDTVIEYLRACARFWQGRQVAIDAWIAEIQAGGTPVLDRFGAKRLSSASRAPRGHVLDGLIDVRGVRAEGQHAQAQYEAAGQGGAAREDPPFSLMRRSTSWFSASTAAPSAPTLRARNATRLSSGSATISTSGSGAGCLPSVSASRLGPAGVTLGA